MRRTTKLLICIALCGVIYLCTPSARACEAPGPCYDWNPSTRVWEAYGCVETPCTEDYEYCDETSCTCEVCKGWDEGDPIEAYIRYDTPCYICQWVDLKGSGASDEDTPIIDYDHWIDGNGQEDEPTDTLSYEWDLSTGTNAETGIFVSETDKDHVRWWASPCIGTVNITLTVNDAPDAMFDECPGTASDARDDDKKVVIESVDVLLPVGCPVAGPHDSSVEWWPDGDDYNWTNPGSEFGDFTYNNATYTVDFAYDTCRWVCEITNVCASTRIRVSASTRPG